MEYEGYTITIEQDGDYYDTPLDWTTPEERGATFALKHSEYDLPFELENKYDNEGTNIVDLDLYSSWAEFAKACAPDNQKCYKFVRWYEHSGVAVSLQDDDSGYEWDAGIAGVIFGTDDEAIRDAFTDWQYFVEGNIWTVYVTDPDGDAVDSISGIMGYEQAEQEGIAIVNYALSKPRHNHKPKHARAMHV